MVISKKYYWIGYLFLIGMLLISCRAWITADTLPWVGEGPVLFKDSFSSKTGGWSTKEDNLSFSGYQNGKFRLWVNLPHFQFWSIPGLNFENIQVYTKAQKIGGPDNNLFGVLCRYQNEANYYAFVIGSDGYYGIYRVLDGEKSLLGQDQLGYDEVINRGNAENEIIVVCQADQLLLVVNNKRLIQVNDTALTYGDVGLIVGNYDKPGTDILFDNFIVTKP